MNDKQTLQQNFLQLQFGMFIHFGLYSLSGEHEWFMYRKMVSIPKYLKSYLTAFNPDPAGMEQWVTTAKAMGAKYIICTSKHHDGFCLWPSNIPRQIYPEYIIQNTAFYQKHHRGVLDFLYDACKKHQIKLGLYHSAVDWSWSKKPWLKPHPFYNPDPVIHQKYMAYYEAQLLELGKRYPDLLCFWFDGNHFRPGFPEIFEQNRIHEVLTHHFPSTLVVSNTGYTEPLRITGKTDLIILETADHSGKLTEALWPRSDPDQLAAEVCLTLNKHWGYNRKDKSYKEPEKIAQLVLANIERRSNTLLNFGPAPNGFILDEQVAIAKKIGEILSQKK